MTADLAKFAMAIVAVCWSVCAFAAADMALLRVTGQGDPTDFNCPTPKARQVLTHAMGAITADMTGLTEGDVKSLTMTDSLTHADPGTLTIGLWGDSHTASGTFTDSMLQALRLPLAQTHPSFIAPTFGVKGVRQPLRRACLSSDWQLALAYRSPKERPESYAKSLSAIHTTQTGAFMWLDFRYPSAQTRVKWADLHIAEDSAELGLVLGITIDDGAESIVQLKPTRGMHLRVQAEQPFATLKLRLVTGTARIDGIAPVYDGKTQVIMDVFSIPGATAKGWRIVNQDHLRREDPLGNGYDVVILQSGTNESLDPDFKLHLYERQISTSLSRLKAAYPQARCILIGPPDAQRSSNTLRLINDSQYRLAIAQGCAHWHWQKAMGGMGTSHRWMVKGWMQADLLHLTHEGYAQSARSLVSVVPIKPR